MDERYKNYLRQTGHSAREIAKMELEERIDAAYYRHKAETLEAPQTWSRDEWTAIYKDAGMTDEEIAAYREEEANQKPNGAEVDFLMMP